MHDPIVDLLSTLGIVGGGGAVFGWFILSTIKKKVTDVEEIPSLRSRVTTLEQQMLTHNDTKEAVIRMEEQIKNLAEQVRSLSDLLMRKVFH
jgi:hypothetical protein